MFGAITDTDRRRWQLRAHRALAVMLDHAAREGLPTLTWTLPPSGGLVGDVDTLTTTQAEQRATFEAWVTYLDAERWNEIVRDTGDVHLHAQYEWQQDDGRVRGAIRADIRPDAEGGDA